MPNKMKIINLNPSSLFINVYMSIKKKNGGLREGIMDICITITSIIYR
jgi:hypothetical protein